jgi:hypothetical protein
MSRIGPNYIPTSESGTLVIGSHRLSKNILALLSQRLTHLLRLWADRRPKRACYFGVAQRVILPAGKRRA